MTSIHTPLKGGLNLAAPPNQIKPGQLLFCQNFECPIEGGYRAIKGYEELTGTVPGKGPILGVAAFRDHYVAIREQSAGNTAALYKNTGSGWTLVGSGMEVGRYSIDDYTFKATDYYRALYMVGGGKPWKYDGNSLSQITSAPSGAQWLKCHNFHLFLGFEVGSIQHSGVGNPEDWAGGNAGEFGTSDALTGFSSTTGGVLIAFCRNSIQALYGQSRQSFQLKRLTANAGAKPWTVADMVSPYFISERGISNLQAVQAFGDFTPATVGYQVDPLFKQGFVPSIVLVNKASNQLRVFSEEGQGIYLTTYATETVGATTVQFEHAVRCSYSGELDSGEEVSLFGSDDGRVYRFDQGDSFAGLDIVSTMTTAFNTFGSPDVRKRIRRIALDLTNTEAIDLKVLPQFNGGDADIARHRAQVLGRSAAGGFWGQAQWDGFAWSGPIQARDRISIAGTATDMALTFSCLRNGTAPFSITGYTTQYEARRLERG
ncbi:hypothetical protein [Neptunomonas sp. XY-337]|uniref:hypothetical protein n=1 Tax=Neptunomonas sp. XY-337 TaxID=2561897 RepID=UPI0010AA9131|nr:hypothetical protein [Neptunomonas sp. XY-337]